MKFNQLIILHIMALQASTLVCSPVFKRAPSENDAGTGGTAAANVALTLAWAAAGLCFPSTARVSLEDGKLQEMSQLRVGDRVQTALPDGTNVYTEVKTFLDKKHSTINMYKSIETFGNSTLSVSGNHLIYARRKLTEHFIPIYANKVSIYDEVLGHENDRVTPMKVKNISNIYMLGAYSPLTAEGNLMVDGVLASCYASFPEHDMAHFAMAPMRWFPKLMHWIFGEDKESPVYVKIKEYIGRSMSPNMIL